MSAPLKYTDNEYHRPDYLIREDRLPAHLLRELTCLKELEPKKPRPSIETTHH
jgi:hypothetical protein